MLGWKGVWVRLVLTVAAVLWVGTVLAAGIPHKINYQGLLSDSETGQPLAGTYDLTLRLYGAPAGGDILWSESKSVTTDQAGVFATVLGSHSALDVPFDSPCWLEVELEGEVLAPRRELVSVPYAFHALNADSLGGLRSDSYALAGHLHDDLYVNEGQVGSITGGMIGDGEITDADVAAGAAIDPGKIAGTAWTSTTDGGSSGLEADLLDGQHAAEFAEASHAHDDRYYTESEVSTADGTVNQIGDPVDWTKLKGMPGGFADGVDNAGAGDGFSLDAADGSPTDVVYVDNDGKVLIGSAAPIVAKLHVAAGPSQDAVFGVTNNGTGTYGYSISGTGVVGGSDTGTGVMGISNSGRAGAFTGNVFISGTLGVGAATPASKLDVDGDINTSSVYRVGGRTIIASVGSRCLFVGAGTGGSYGASGVTALGDSAGHSNQSGACNVFVGDRSGYANTTGSYNGFFGQGAGGYNTSGRQNTCLGHLAGAANDTGDYNTYVGAFAGHWAEGTGNACLGKSAGMSADGDRNTCLGAFAGCDNETGNGNVFIGYSAGYYEAGSNKLYIANDSLASKVLIYGDFATGRLGLGTLAPERKLHIVGDGPRVLIEGSTGNPEVNFKLAGDPASDVWAIYKRSDTEDLRFYQGGDRVTFQYNTGNVAIAATDPLGYRLYVNGTAYATGSWQSSDLRLKTDLKGIEDALDKVQRLSGHSFRWRTEDYADRGLPEGRHYGLVAQEVEEVLPEVVGKGPGDEKALAYSELIPVLVEAVKQLKAESDEMRAENQSLRQRLEALERTGGR